jgi:hypothetical protein
MVTLPGDVCMEQSRQRDVNDLPDDIYTIPDMMDVCQVQNSEGEKQVSGSFRRRGKREMGVNSCGKETHYVSKRWENYVEKNSR